MNFNHFFTIIDSLDLHALKSSDFIKNRFSSLTTDTTEADSPATWTGTYLDGIDNYFELFDSSGFSAPLGSAGIAFSVDKIGEINQLDSVLLKKYTVITGLREKQYDDKKIPWFTWLGIKDFVFDSLSHISFWVMEYKHEYFDYNHWKYDKNKLTRTTYLNQYAEKRRNKILKRFTGVTLKATEEEKRVISNFLTDCGYDKMNDNSFSSQEHYIIRFFNRSKVDRYAIASVEFVNNMLVNDTVKISDNIEIRLRNTKGMIIFK